MNARNSILEVQAKVLKLTIHAANQVSMRISCPKIADKARPGSFVHVKCSDSLGMRRPMSIMRASKTEGWIEIFFKIIGQGTKALAENKIGSSLSVLGPIGNPFRLDNFKKQTILIGGGVGIPPLLFLAEYLSKSKEDVKTMVLMGSEIPFPFPLSPSLIYVDGIPGEAIAAIPLLEGLKIPSRLASNQDYPGCYAGFVTDLATDYLENIHLTKEDLEIFACGPTPMLIAIQNLAKKYDVRCQLSVEEYMACAVGGCAGCTILVKTSAGLQMKKVCVDGPVFNSDEVILAE